MSVEVSAKQAGKFFEKHKELAAPAIISATLTVVLVIGFVFLSGAHTVAHELISHHQHWEESSLPIEFAEYLALREYDAQAAVSGLLTLNNLWLLLGFVALKLLLSWYLGCMAWAMIARIKKHSTKGVFAQTNEYFLRYIGLHALTVFLIYAPITLFVFASIYVLFSASTLLLGIGSAALLLIILIIYLVAATLRLIFTTPSLFDKKHGPVKALAHGYHVTAHHFQHVILVTLVAVALAITAYYVGQSPASASLRTLLLSTQAAMTVLATLGVALFVIIEAVIVTYERIFLYEAYEDHLKMK